MHYFPITKTDAKKEPLTYVQFMDKSRYDAARKKLLQVTNNELAALLRETNDIRNPITEPFIVDDPTRHGTTKPRKYNAAILACAKKTHLMYFRYLVEHRIASNYTKPPQKPAPFIAIEGPDFSGKTSQVEAVLKWCNRQGYAGKAVATKAPSGAMRAFLLSDESKVIPIVSRALANVASMKDTEINVVIPALDSGCPVVTDRWVGTTYAYQVQGQGLDKAVLKDICAAVNLRMPDVTIILSVSDKTIKQRQAKRQDEINHLDLLPVDVKFRIREAYGQTLKTFMHTPTYIVNGEGPRSAVANRIRDVLDLHFSKEN